MDKMNKFKIIKLQILIVCLFQSMSVLADLTKEGTALIGKDLNPNHLKAHIEPIGEFRNVEIGDMRINESKSIRMKVALYYGTGEPESDVLLSEEIFECNAKDEDWNITAIYNESLRQQVYSKNQRAIPTREQRQAAVASASSQMTSREYSPWPAICNGAYEKFKSHEKQIYSAKTLGMQTKLTITSDGKWSWLVPESEEKAALMKKINILEDKINEIKIQEIEESYQRVQKNNKVFLEELDNINLGSMKH